MAGFFDPKALVVLGLDPDAEELFSDIAELGRMNGIGDVPPGFGDAAPNEDGC